MELLDSAARAAGEWEDVLVVLGSRFTDLGGVFVDAKSEPPKAPEQAAAKPKRPRKRRGKGARQSSMAPAAPDEAVAEVVPSAEGVKSMSPEAREIGLRMARVLGEELGRGEEAIARLKDLATAVPDDDEVLSSRCTPAF
jgi:hypothetical protein